MEESSPPGAPTTATDSKRHRQGAEPAMNVADDQPWSPFPVQDWSALPADPLGSVAVNPTWPPPQPQRSWWRPLVVFGLVAALVAAAAFVASSVGVAARATAAADYLPSDGAVSYERTDTTRELKSCGRRRGNRIGAAVRRSRPTQYRRCLRRQDARCGLSGPRPNPDSADHDDRDQ